MSHKIHFESKELTAIHETELFRTKYRVMDKVAHLFGAASEKLKPVIHNFQLPKEVGEKRVKIFRGENYLQLPYVVMDYPALFGKVDVFAYRTMFWWGNFFSFSLQLSGLYLEKYQKHLLTNLNELEGKEFYFCVNSTPWQYHYNADNYLFLDDLLKDGGSMINKQFSERNFVKLSHRIKISEWNNVSKKCAETFQLLMNITGAERKQFTNQPHA
ncbi:MAG TPA: hypothetical protein VI757_09770 [Bacteroidia bacterium]|nr:hypothetical protein [Bacteroidia bacterium]